MSFEHKGYTLYKREIELRGGRPQTIYFFSKRKPKAGTPCEMPRGYKICEKPEKNFMYLKKV